jgi:hypothetical protein
METKDGLGVSLFFKALIVDGGEEEKGVVYISSIFYFHVCSFLGSFTHKGGGKVGYGVKNFKKLLIFLILCKSLIFFSFSKAERVHGFRVNKYNLYLLD